MKLYRIKISSWTSSFRYPNIISGFQPTLDVPPVSTVLGIINACAGKYQEFDRLEIGYYFDYQAKAVDLETIYQVERHKEKGHPLNQVKPNIINREFLFDCRLFIYVKEEQLTHFFESPHYQLVMGRSNDLATIEEIKEIEAEEIRDAQKVKGQVIPLKGNYLPGVIQALPKYFTNTIPRNTLGTEAYTVISCHDRYVSTALTAYRDEIDGKEVDIYMHKINLWDE